MADMHDAQTCRSPPISHKGRPSFIPLIILFLCCQNRQANFYTCSLDAMRGTSMATPIVAGGLLLIRQYFTEGWYPSGAANSSRSYTPSGPLMKAVLLGDSLPMSNCWLGIACLHSLCFRCLEGTAQNILTMII